MSARIVVGYSATDAGDDAVALGSRLAAASGSALELVLVLPGSVRGLATPPDPGYDRYVREQADAWLARGAAGIPDAVPHRVHVRYADSFAVGLMDAADDVHASMIVVGAAGDGARGRHRLGTVANELLHASDVPVALAPEGSRLVDPSVGLTRVTAALGEGKGRDAVLAESIALASRSGAPLRLLSLVTVDLPADVDTGVIRIAGEGHTREILAQARKTLPAGLEADAVVGAGESIEEAVQALAWDPAEIAVVGSGRLARKRRLFLGSTAAKMLRVLRVPMVVVPRSWKPKSRGGDS